MKRSEANPNVFYQFKIWLLDAPLPIWRRILIRSDVPLNMLHEVTQIAMGWEDTHQYEFQIGRRRFTDPDQRRAPGVENDLDTNLCELVSRPGDTLNYVYNFAANWQHEIVLESVTTQKQQRPYAYCFTGKRACPPEKVLGVAGYREFINAIEDTFHPKRDEMLKLLNWDFDPAAFDVSQVNIRLLTMDAELTMVEKDLAARRKGSKLVLLKRR